MQYILEIVHYIGIFLVSAILSLTNASRKAFSKVAAAEKTFKNECVVLINDNFMLSDVETAASKLA